MKDSGRETPAIEAAEAQPAGQRLRTGARELAILAAGAALMIGVQVAMAPLPNIEAVSLLIILLTLHFSWRALWSVAVFVLVEGLLYGFGLWFLSWLYLWPILVVLTLAFRRILGKSPLGWAILSGAYGLLFGALYAIVYLFIGGPSLFLSGWLSGIPFDVAHCVGNFVICLVLFRPLERALQRLLNASRTEQAP